MLTPALTASDWGRYTSHLELPVMAVHLTGLSEIQVQEIAGQYALFQGAKSCNTGNTLQCSAYRITESPKWAPDEFSVHGQYALQKVRRGDVLELTGVNFTATIQLGMSMSASLGVATEEELAYPNVLENFLRVSTAYNALLQGGVLLHSAGLVFDEKAYIFIGHSNAGKTTLTRKAYAQNALVLSDDMNLLLPSSHGYRAYSVPFAGEFGRTLDQQLHKSYPVAGIILLEQGEQLRVRPIRASQTVADIWACCPFVNDDEHESEALFDTLCDGVAQLKVCRLTSRLDDPAHAIMAEIQQVFHDV